MQDGALITTLRELRDALNQMSDTELDSELLGYSFDADNTYYHTARLICAEEGYWKQDIGFFYPGEDVEQCESGACYPAGYDAEDGEDPPLRQIIPPGGWLLKFDEYPD